MNKVTLLRQSDCEQLTLAFYFWRMPEGVVCSAFGGLAPLAPTCVLLLIQVMAPANLLIAKCN